MKPCKPTGICLIRDNLLKDHFPYARVSEQGEYIIPKDRLDEFVRKYIELADASQHLERLAAYRVSGERANEKPEDD